MVAGGLAAVIASGASAQKRGTQTGTPASIQSLLACRGMTDSAQRLACYDRASGTIASAISTRDLVMIDKAKATQTKRALFGFSVPDFGGLFGGGGGPDEIREIASTVTTFGRNAEGGWLIKLADGSSWSQTDDAMLGLPPRRGDKVVVARGSFGAFYLRLAGQPGFKVKRVG
jgi:hypothetical protein